MKRFDDILIFEGDFRSEKKRSKAITVTILIIDVLLFMAIVVIATLKGLPIN